MAISQAAVRMALAAAKRSRAQALAFIEDNSFCTLISTEQGALCTSHVNLIQDTGPDTEELFFGHLAKANPQAKQLRNNSIQGRAMPRAF